jgi:hypothetical protein
MLTTLSSIKSGLGLELFDPTEDPLLTNILKHVSARFAAECNRIFDYGTGLTYEFRADEVNIFNDHPPIELVSQFDLKSSESEGWLPKPPSTIFYLRPVPGSNSQSASAPHVS